MTFPTTSSRASLAGALAEAQSIAASVKQACTSSSAAMAAGPVAATLVLSLLDTFRTQRARLATIGALPGIGTFAVEQIGQEVASDFSDMTAALDQVTAWIIANLPKDASGWLLLESMDAAGVRTWRSFTSAQTAGLRTRLTTLAATIA